MKYVYIYIASNLFFILHRFYKIAKDKYMIQHSPEFIRKLKESGTATVTVEGCARYSTVRLLFATFFGFFLIPLGLLILIFEAIKGIACIMEKLNSFLGDKVNRFVKALPFNKLHSTWLYKFTYSCIMRYWKI